MHPAILVVFLEFWDFTSQHDFIPYKSEGKKVWIVRYKLRIEKKKKKEIWIVRFFTPWWDQASIALPSQELHFKM